ncbi:hypothetical protein C5167_024395, partial [Papaver somniferum]
DQIGIRNSSKDAVSVITTWQELLQHYGPSTDVQIEIIRKFEEICLEFAQDYAPAFDRILQELCEKKVPTKEAILKPYRAVKKHMMVMILQLFFLNQPTTVKLKKYIPIIDAVPPQTTVLSNS